MNDEKDAKFSEADVGHCTAPNLKGLLACADINEQTYLMEHLIEALTPDDSTEQVLTKTSSGYNWATTIRHVNRDRDLSDGARAFLDAHLADSR